MNERPAFLVEQALNLLNHTTAIAKYKGWLSGTGVVPAPDGVLLAIASTVADELGVLADLDISRSVFTTARFFSDSIPAKAADAFIAGVAMYFAQAEEDTNNQAVFADIYAKKRTKYLTATEKKVDTIPKGGFGCEIS